MKLVKIIYILTGFIAMTLGIIGIFLPILPTVPFLLLASFCFARGSERFHRWFTETGLYKKQLEEFDKNRSMPLKTKIMLLAFSSSMLMIPIVKLNNPYIRTALILLVLFKYYYFIFKIKTVRKNRENK